MYEREIAGVSIGAASLLLVWKGEYAYAITLLVGMLSFFTGERNGQRKAANKT